MEKLKIGQTVFAKPQSNALRRGCSIKEAIITSVGKKYFTLEGFRNKFYLPNSGHNSMRELTDYICNWHIYTSMKEIEDIRNRPLVLVSINNELSKMSVDELNELLNEIQGNKYPLA